MKKKFTNLCCVLVFYTLVVILWGAWVRISKSGDGCGNHWPLCQGEILPDGSSHKTWIEYTHRLMSGVFGLVIVCTYLLGRKVFKNIPQMQLLLNANLVLTIIEALLGAALVKLSLVADNSSIWRVLFMNLHLINSLLLTGSIFLLYLSSRYEQYYELKKIIKNQGLMAFLIVGSAGTIAALANTLFPSESLQIGLQQDFAAESHWLVNARIIHPILALAFVASLFFLTAKIRASHLRTEKMKKTLWGLVIILIGFGVANLVVHHFVFLKLAHLLTAYLVWLCLIHLAVLSQENMLETKI